MNSEHQRKIINFPQILPFDLDPQMKIHKPLTQLIFRVFFSSVNFSSSYGNKNDNKKIHFYDLAIKMCIKKDDRKREEKNISIHSRNEAHI